jgi:hypothetical protein
MSNANTWYRVTFDSDMDTGDFIVHRSNQGLPDLKFKMHPSGLHVYDPTNNELVMVNTVKGNMEGYTKKQVEGAKLAKELYAKLAYPSPKDFKWAVMSNQIQNCPVTKPDIKNAKNIWGKDIAALKGKTVNSK